MVLVQSREFLFDEQIFCHYAPPKPTPSPTYLKLSSSTLQKPEDKIETILTFTFIFSG